MGDVFKVKSISPMPGYFVGRLLKPEKRAGSIHLPDTAGSLRMYPVLRVVVAGPDEPDEPVSSLRDQNIEDLVDIRENDVVIVTAAEQCVYVTGEALFIVHANAVIAKLYNKEVWER